MKVLVLMGGTSSERDISIASAVGVVKALQAIGHEVVAIDTAQGNKQLSGQKALEIHIGATPPSLEELGQLSPRKEMEALITTSLDRVDVIFNALHGGTGENGTIQALLDMVGIPYTGSGVLASALAMDKNLSKLIFKQVGVSTAPWIYLREGHFELPRVIQEIQKSFGFPVVVKPNDQGSTIGFSIVTFPEELAAAVEIAGNYSREILVEKYIAGRELTVSVLEDQVLPVIEIKPDSGVYDYTSKYTKGKTNYLCPAPLDDGITKKIQAEAKKAFDALKCEGYARVDFRLGVDDQCYCLEVNTLPGMTETSLVPKAARAAEIEMPQLVEKIIQFALGKKKIR